MRTPAIFFVLFFFSLLVTDVFAEKTPVTTLELGKLWKDYTYDAPADVLALNRSDISAQISAQVSKTFVQAGDSVTAGMLLGELDCQSYILQQQVREAGLQQAQAQLPFARQQLKRVKELIAKKSISDELLDLRLKELKIAEADYALNRNQLKLAQRDVENCAIKAPYDGVVLERLVSQGTLVSAGSIMFKLLQANNVEVSARVLRDQLAELHKSNDIWFESAGYRLPLKLREVIPLLDGASLTLEIRLSVDSTQQALAGDTGRLKWRNGSRQLPANLLISRDSKLGLFIVEEGIAQFVQVDDAIEGRPFSVNLPDTTEVVIEGRYRLQQGDQLQTDRVNP